MADLFHRVSIRKYQDRIVEKEKVEYMLRAAMAAPSAKNQQPWEFYVVTDPEKIQALAGATPYTGPCGGALTVIVTAYRKNCAVPEYAQIDMSSCMENLWLAADEIGLGGVWMGIAPIKERMKAVEEIVRIPEEQHAFGLFSVGYPAQEKKQQDRFERERIHYV